jgi:hypothetical protein
MRAVKAERGWGTVCTEYCSIHPTSDDHPSPFAALWDQGDVANLAVLVEGVHRRGIQGRGFLTVFLTGAPLTRDSHFDVCRRDLRRRSAE